MKGKYADLLPDLSSDEYAALKESIRTKGLQVPIIKNSSGEVIDGLHREQVCKELGITPIYSEPKEFKSEDDEKEFVLSINIAHRNLSPEQKRALVIQLRNDGWTQQRIEDITRIPQQTISRWLGNISNTQMGNTNTPLDLRSSLPSNAKEEIYNKIGIGKSQQEIADEYKISQGRVSQIVTQIEARQHKPKSSGGVPYPNKLFKCIVIDPAWPMQKIEREVVPNQGKELDYPVMSLDEIENLKVTEHADPDGCHIFLWTTNRFLPSALDIFKKWGVAYQCILVWVKNGGITPFSFMYNLEFVLFGRIGHLPLLEYGIKQSFEDSEGFSGERRRHSEKPESFFELIRKVSPEPRWEMFARKPHDGFEPWGDAVENA